MSRVRLGVAVLGLVALTAPNPANGYRFFRIFGNPSLDNDVPLLYTLETARRWEADDFPLRFRMLENENLPTDFEITEASWAGIVSRSLDRWNEIPTAEIELELESATVGIAEADASDGINTIGFSAYDGFRDSWFTAFAAMRADAGRLSGCDIEVNPDFRKNWAPQDPVRLLEIVAIHEVGHCLQLGHTEPHPMPLWTSLPVGKDAAFLPDPVMSYSNSYAPELTEDEITGVSLLYPAPGFLTSRGRIEGTVRLSGGPAAGPVAFAYVQAIRPGGRAGPGPGVFTNGNGEFLLEGLPPGDWMLWVRPILVVRRNAHGRLLTHAEEVGQRDFADRLRWIRVSAGATLTGVDITVEPGRDASRQERIE